MAISLSTRRMSMGLDRWASMPHSSEARTSSAKAFADMVMMGKMCIRDRVLLDHLGRILAPIQRVIDVRFSDIGKAVKYAHSLSISRLAPPPAPHARALSAEV